MSIKYPRLIINREKVKENIRYINNKCNDANIKMTAVTKGFSSIPEIVEEIIGQGVQSIGESRLEKIVMLRKEGITCEMILLRIPMISELDEVLMYTDISLHSEAKTLRILNEKAKKLNMVHKVILMVDLGDLREGIFEDREILFISKLIKNTLLNINLEGIGANLGCYGSIKPTVENLSRLVEIKKIIEKENEMSLNIVSGGGTSTLPLLFDGTIPKEINHLRCGEAISCAKSLHDNWKVHEANLQRDAIYIETEVVEIKEKPSYPIGIITQDAFGNKPKYTDMGKRIRAIVALGKKDVGDVTNLDPFDMKIKIIGSSSDHLILDITESDKSYDIGDVVAFHIKYPAMLYATTCDCVIKVFE